MNRIRLVQFPGGRYENVLDVRGFHQGREDSGRLRPCVVFAIRGDDTPIVINMPVDVAPALVTDFRDWMTGDPENTDRWFPIEAVVSELKAATTR